MQMRPLQGKDACSKMGFPFQHPPTMKTAKTPSDKKGRKHILHFTGPDGQKTEQSFNTVAEAYREMFSQHMKEVNNDEHAAMGIDNEIKIIISSRKALVRWNSNYEFRWEIEERQDKNA